MARDRHALTPRARAPSVGSITTRSKKEGFQMTVFTHDALRRVAG